MIRSMQVRCAVQCAAAVVAMLSAVLLPGSSTANTFPACLVHSPSCRTPTLPPCTMCSCRLASAGYQGAYGIVVEVESHPFDLGTMLFMDWRDDHLDATPDIKQRNAE